MDEGFVVMGMLVGTHSGIFYYSQFSFSLWKSRPKVDAF